MDHLAPFVVPTVTPRRSWVQIDGQRRTIVVADEIVELKGYDATPVRQLSAYEGGKVVFQILTPNTALNAARLVRRLRGRWCIENTNKYLEDHQDVHWLATYEMDTEANTAKVTNSARKAARVTVRDAQEVLAEAQRALGRTSNRRSGDLDEYLAQVRARDDEYRAITRNLLHLGGTIVFDRRRMTVTLDRPDSPRVARALGQLLRELADETLAHLAGDRSTTRWRGDRLQQSVTAHYRRSESSSK